MLVRNPDTVRAWIIYLHGTSMLTYRQIAEKPYFSNPPSVPPGTICSIAKGAPWPKKYRRGRGIPEQVKVQVCPIHGVVHDYDCQAEKPVPLAARVIKPSGKKDKRRRPTLGLRDPEQDAITLLGKNPSREYLERFVECLDLKG